MVALPAYSLVLGLFALLGYAAIAAHTRSIVNAATGEPDSNTIIPMLFEGAVSIGHGDTVLRDQLIEDLDRLLPA
jgi:hypothetical protein